MPSSSCVLLVLLISPSLSLTFWPSQCVPEASLDLGLVHLASSVHLEEYSAQACALHCLAKQPRTKYAAVSYRPAPFLGLLGDKFNCICGLEGAVPNQGVKPEDCSRTCPQGGLLCGDTAADLLSSYCLTLGCHGEPRLCQAQKPHEAQGCVPGESVHWAKVTHMREFPADASRADCVWRCREEEGEGLALTRVTEGSLSCSCAPLLALQPDTVLREEVCEHLGHTVYSVSCEGDLHPSLPTPPPFSPPPHSTLQPPSPPPHITSHPSLPSPHPHRAACPKEYIGCVYRTLFPLASGLEVTISSVVLPRPLQCQSACAALSSLYLVVGVSWNSSLSSLSCSCSPLSLPSSIMGPELACPPTGLGGPEAFSVWCVGSRREEEQGTAKFELSEIYTVTRSTRVAMQGIAAILVAILVSSVSAVSYLYRK